MTPPDSPSKGSLEDLFRHHLLDSEAAAVPPRPHVWEQMENALLLQENTRYRRRLRASYYAMAASLLLAAILGGGWWRNATRPAPTLAGYAASNTETGPSRAVPARLPTAPGRPAATTPASPSTSSIASIDQTATSSSALPAASPAAPAFALPSAVGLGSYYGPVGQAGPGRATELVTAFQVVEPSSHSRTGRYAHAIAVAAEPAGSAPEASAPVEEAVIAALPAGLLAARPTGLRLPGAAALPGRLAAGAGWAATRVVRPTRPWQLQASYAAGVFNPNIDFRKELADYDVNLGPGSLATSRDAAAEYRHNLRGGLSQRLSVWASRRLGLGRWSVRTGLEFSQSRATSSSSVAFVGEQVATFAEYKQVQSTNQQSTSYLYRSLSVPVEFTYVNPLRHGFSLYGRAGGAMSALLSARSEVAGTPEATRYYTLASGYSVYRTLLASVRGGAGVRFQPAAHPWALSVGPVADAGVLSFNLDPSQDFWNQRRPYSVGLEAGVEFGSWLRPSAAR